MKRDFVTRDGGQTTTPSSSLGDDRDQDSGVVGEGPLYEPMLQNARDLIPVWIPWGVENSQNWWGAGPFSVFRSDDGTHTLSVSTFGWEKRGLGLRTTADLKTLRAAAISLLVYCAAEESRGE